MLHLLELIRSCFQDVLAIRGGKLPAWIERLILCWVAVPLVSFSLPFLYQPAIQYLQDVLAICGGTLPAWTERLVFGARFLFPFALRRAWFKATALGLPRALAHLQASLL